MRKRAFARCVFVLLNALGLLAVMWSLVIYASLCEGVPWYEPCGLQLVDILVLTAPTLIAVGIGLLVLDRFHPVSRTAKAWPFVAAVGLSLPVVGGIGVGVLVLIVILIIRYVVMMSRRHTNDVPQPMAEPHTEDPAG